MAGLWAEAPPKPTTTTTTISKSKWRLTSRTAGRHTPTSLALAFVAACPAPRRRGRWGVHRRVCTGRPHESPVPWRLAAGCLTTTQCWPLAPRRTCRRPLSKSGKGESRGRPCHCSAWRYLRSSRALEIQASGHNRGGFARQPLSRVRVTTRLRLVHKRRQLRPGVVLNGVWSRLKSSLTRPTTTFTPLLRSAADARQHVRARARLGLVHERTGPHEPAVLERSK